jgi:hypothetical protein
MAYPRECEGCGVRYPAFPGQGPAEHVTISAQDGGTPSPWVPDKPGRVLEIGCTACGAVYKWNYFGEGLDGRLGMPLGLVRAPVEGWELGDGFRSGRLRSVALEERKAS